jgi:hypothetical protein
MMTVRIDPIDAQTRCVHDMLTGQCSLCKGLPDLPLFESLHVDDSLHHGRPLRFVPWDKIDECVSCSARIRIGQLSAWSPILAGVVCADCDAS